MHKYFAYLLISKFLLVLLKWSEQNSPALIALVIRANIKTAKIISLKLWKFSNFKKRILWNYSKASFNWSGQNVNEFAERIIYASERIQWVSSFQRHRRDSKWIDIKMKMLLKQLRMHFIFFGWGNKKISQINRRCHFLVMTKLKNRSNCETFMKVFGNIFILEVENNSLRDLKHLL